MSSHASPFMTAMTDGYGHVNADDGGVKADHEAHPL